jgi:hypothetical protein
MRIFLVLICSLALASLALSAEQGKGKKKEEPKKQAAHAGQVSQLAGKGGGKPTAVGHAAGAGKPTGASKPTGARKPAEFGKSTGAGRPTAAGKPEKVGKTTGAGKPAGAGKVTGAGKPEKVGKATGAGKPVAAGGVAGAKMKPQHFNLANKPKPEVAPAVTFQQNRRIEGSQNWQGSNYTVFRNYSSQWHDRNWWGSRYNRIVFVFGSPYYWDAGYWYPAWGYDQGAYYPYDGPIYGYNDLPPDQVIANAQAALQQQGYYRGEVDGLLGPLTRAAIADYQRDHGLYITSAIDRPTLSSLGLA